MTACRPGGIQWFLGCHEEILLLYRMQTVSFKLCFGVTLHLEAFTAVIVCCEDTAAREDSSADGKRCVHSAYKQNG